MTADLAYTDSVEYFTKPGQDSAKKCEAISTAIGKYHKITFATDVTLFGVV